MGLLRAVAVSVSVLVGVPASAQACLMHDPTSPFYGVSHGSDLSIQDWRNIVMARRKEAQAKGAPEASDAPDGESTAQEDGQQTPWQRAAQMVRIGPAFSNGAHIAARIAQERREAGRSPSDR